jgi:hypothetical protein
MRVAWSSDVGMENERYDPSTVDLRTPAALERAEVRTAENSKGKARTGIHTDG